MTQFAPTPVRRTDLKTSAAFARREDGSTIIFSLFMFVLMLMIVGISLDVERFETARTKVQNTADGAVLAAASLSQDIPAAEIVQNYFEVSGMAAFFEDVHVVEDPGSKQVTVETDVNVPTHFMNMLGIDNLAAPVVSIAAESVSDIEISLVLDVSGSMSGNSKLDNLKTAAKEFVDTVYSDARPGTISTSIVPYSTQVSIGPDVLKQLANVEDRHDLSACINFDAEDFDSTSLDLAATYEQTLEFDAWSTWWDPEVGLNYTECNGDQWTNALIMSQNTAALKTRIDEFQATFNTSIDLGMKWGSVLLDPSFQPVVTGMIADGTVEPVFAGRPAAMDDDQTMKVLVVMTDGINTSQFRVLNAFRNDKSSRVFVHYDDLGRPYYNIYTGIAALFKDVSGDTGTDMWYLANDYSGGADMGLRDAPYGGTDIVNLTYNELWAEIPVRYYIDTILPAMGGINVAVATVLSNVMTASNSVDKDPQLLATCTAAKDAGITVYAVGFEAPATSQTLLQQCASTPSHYFNVAGTEISQAFSSIAADISRLRLLN